MDDERLKEVLQSEFLLYMKEWNREAISHARNSLVVFDNLAAFFYETGWDKNNPEVMSEIYLTENRICRWVDRKFLYFSRILWEEGSGKG